MKSLHDNQRRRFRRRAGTERGIVSVFTMLIASFFLMMGLGALGLQDAAIRDSSDIGQSTQARFLAQSALSEARYYITDNPDWVGTSAEQIVTDGGKNVGTYDYTVTKTGGNIYTVTGSGYVPNKAAATKVTKSETLKIINPAPLVLFEDGFESNDLALWTVFQDNPADVIASASNVTPKKGTYHARFYKTAASANGTTNIAHLTSPTLDLSAYDKVILRFTYRMKQSHGPAFRVYQNSTGDAAGWVQIFEDETSQTSGGYTKPSVQLSISPRTSTMQFRFQAEIRQKTEEWFLDAVQISTPFVMYDLAVDG